MRILVTPMDWGLGHASRCVPVVRELVRQGMEVILASAGPSLALLRKYFPDLPAEVLPAYDIRYPSDNMVCNLLWQAPGLAHTVWAEHRAIGRLVRKYDVQCIISDNRFGCHSAQTYNVFITHQLNIRVPGWTPPGPVNELNRFFIQRFDECWIPDLPGPGGLSGALSETAVKIPVHYTGWLTPQQAIETPSRYLCAAVLSGPEPQRSYLEAILRPQLQTLGEPCLLVRGQLEEGLQVEQDGLLTIVPYLFGEALNEAMAAARIVIARSGYSTLMDLAVLQKKAILIPTPGQTEQIYLARRLATQNRCCFQTQRQVNIARAIEQIDQIEPFPGGHAKGLLRERIRNLQTSIRQRTWRK